MHRTNRHLCAAIVVACVAACSSGGTPEEKVAGAREFIAESDYTSAIIELKNALQQDGSYGEARMLLGSAYLDTGDPVSAEKELLRARKLGIPDTEVSPPLARALFQQQKFDDLLAVRTQGLPPETEAEVLALKARAAMATGQNKKGKRYLDDALTLDEDSADALLAQVEMFFNQGELASAGNTLDQILDQDPENATALAIKGDILLADRQFEEAKAAYLQALVISPDLHTHRLKLATLGLQTGDTAMAEEQARILVERAPKYPGGNYIQGLVHFEAGEYNEAITLLATVEPAYEQFPLSLYFLATAHMQLGNTDQAAVLAGRFHDFAPGSVDGRKLLGAIQLRLGQFDKTRTLVQPVIDAYPDDVVAINIMANALVGDGDLEQGLALLERAAQLQPDSATAQVKLGAGLLMSGKSEEAASKLQTALELNPEVQQADILLILNHLREGDEQAAIAAAEAFRQRNPDSTTPLIVLGRVYLQAGMEEKGRNAFTEALEIDPGDPGANQGLASIAIESGDTQAARKRYNAILAEYPDDLRTVLSLAVLDARENNIEGFVKTLEAASAAHPKAVEPRLLLGRHYLGQGRPDKVAPLFDSLEKPQRESVAALNLIASAQVAQRQYQEALDTLERLMARAPETAQMHYLAAMANAGLDDRPAATQSLREAVELDGEFLEARLALARISLVQNDTETFKDELATLRELAPDNADVLVLLAADAATEGQKNNALAFAARAYEVQPSTATLTTLAQYRVAAGDEAGALAVARQWLEENPEDQQIRLFVANQALAAGQQGEAVADFQHILKGNPDHVIALNNLAWMIRDSEPQAALSYIERARKLAPNSPEILDTLAVVQYANKDYKQAASSVREALLRKPDDPSMKYHEAMIAAALGRTAEATAGLEKLLSSGADFPEKAEAQALLAELR